jgi:hypothetical protein
MGDLSFHNTNCLVYKFISVVCHSFKARQFFAKSAVDDHALHNAKGHAFRVSLAARNCHVRGQITHGVDKPLYELPTSNPFLTRTAQSIPAKCLKTRWAPDYDAWVDMMHQTKSRKTTQL